MFDRIRGTLLARTTARHACAITRVVANCSADRLGRQLSPVNTIEILKHAYVATTVLGSRTRRASKFMQAIAWVKGLNFLAKWLREYTLITIENASLIDRVLLKDYSDRLREFVSELQTEDPTISTISDAEMLARIASKTAVKIDLYLFEEFGDKVGTELYPVILDTLVIELQGLL